MMVGLWSIAGNACEDGVAVISLGLTVGRILTRTRFWGDGLAIAAVRGVDAAFCVLGSVVAK